MIPSDAIRKKLRIMSENTLAPAEQELPVVSTPRQLNAGIDIAAPPAEVWHVVSDLRRTPEWSAQCRRVIPLGRIRRGCLLLGFNQQGRTRWVTLSRVVKYRADEEIAWRVLTNNAIWTYRIQASTNGSHLVETRQTPHGITRFARWFTGRFLNGQAWLDDDLEAGMARGLQHIKTLVEDENR